MKTKMIGITPLQHQVSEKEGTMYIIANKNSAFYGLSFFFEEHTTNTKEYIGSFVIHPQEAEAIMEGKVTTVRDLGHIMTTQNSYLDIMNIPGLRTYADDISNPYFEEELMTSAIFELNVNEFQWYEGSLYAEYQKNNNMCGIRLAIVEALRNANEVSNMGSAVVNYTFPTNVDVKLKDYYMPF